MTQPEPRVSPDALEPVIDELVARGRERGSLTSGEIFAALHTLEPETDELADIYRRIEARGVAIQDEITEELELEDARRRDEGPAHRARRGEARPTPVTRPGEAAAPRTRPRRDVASVFDEPAAAVTAARPATSTRSACTSRTSARCRSSPPSKR